MLFILFNVIVIYVVCFHFAIQLPSKLNQENAKGTFWPSESSCHLLPV